MGCFFNRNKSGTCKAARIVVLLLLFLGTLLPSAWAQVSTASVNGTVTDSSGSVIPGVTIVLRNVETAVEKRTLTNDAGNYLILSINPGTYTVEASKTGFGTQKLSPFTLSVNQTATFNISLTVGTMKESVTVTATGVRVESSTSELGATVSSKEVVDLPLNGRNFTQMLSLTPGVSPVSVAQNSGGWLTGPVGQFEFPAVNGQTNRSNYFMLDGINNQGSIVNTYTIPPIIDAVQEFKVESHNDQAEFGQALGGIVNVVTKSGTNNLHGSVWEFLRNDALDARNFFMPSVTPYRWNQFGASAGGPVMLPKLYNGRNKTFFFASYQGFRFRTPASTYYRVPTAKELTGDLSDIPQQIYNPYSTRPDPSNPGAYLRDPFTNNQIPSDLLDPGMVLYAQTTLPAPIATGLANYNQLDMTPTAENQNEYTVRVDENLGEKNFFWFRISGLLQDTTGSGGRQTLVGTTKVRGRNIGLSWAHSFSPQSMLQAQFGRVWSEYDTTSRFRSIPSGFAEQVGFASGFAGNFPTGVTYLPDLEVPGYFSGGENDQLANPSLIWHWKANYSLIRGNHTLKMGGGLDTNSYVNYVQIPTSNFATPQTANLESNTGATGSSLASFLLNVPDSATRRNVHDQMRFGGVWGVYVQDQWKVTRNLTANVGLRYDRTVIPPFGHIGDPGAEVGDLDLTRGIYILQTTSPSCDVALTAPCIPGGVLPDHVVMDPRHTILHDSKDNWQPRVGLAYRMGPNTAVRASFGMFFDNWAGVTQTARNYEGTWPSVGEQSQVNLNYPTAAHPLPTLKATDPIQVGTLPPATPFGLGNWFTDPFIKDPYSMQWNVGVQRQLNQATDVSINYVGSGSRRLDIGGIYNTATTPGPGDVSSRQPYPYISPTYYDRSWGRSDYNALQFNLKRTYSNGLAYMVSYTWSKAMDIGCSGYYGVEGCQIQDPYQFNNDRSVSSFDLTHMLSVNWLYQIPVGQKMRFHTGSTVADYVIGNWQLNGIAFMRSGIPYGISVDGDIANTGNSGYMHANQVGDPKLSNPTPARWFNTDAFASPAAYTYGDFGRNRLRTDWGKNVDLSLFRDFPIKESKLVQFRIEWFNSFNTPVFGTPNADLSSLHFGQVSSTQNSPRTIQFALKIIY